jgi:hypothetical protein
MYEGYMRLHVYTTSHNIVGFMYKVLDMQPGIYYVEFPLNKSFSLMVPLKYYKYPREDKRAGGDAGIFVIPQHIVRSLAAWGIRPGYVYVKIWGRA